MTITSVKTYIQTLTNLAVMLNETTTHETETETAVFGLETETMSRDLTSLNIYRLSLSKILIKPTASFASIDCRRFVFSNETVSNEITHLVRSLLNTQTIIFSALSP
jgi:hypothetical protein